MVFLEWLLEDEIERRSQKALSIRWTGRDSTGSRALRNSTSGTTPNVPVQMIRDLATCGFVERAESVIICGPVGVGKSHVAQAIGHAACHRGYRYAT